MLATGPRIALAAIALAALVSTGSALAAPPSYSVRWIGPGYPAAVNQRGDVVGFEIVGSAYRPWIAPGGGQPIALPLPAGYPSAQPADVNGLGAIVGQASSSVYASGVAVLWTPTAAGGYAVQVLPVLPGDVAGAAAAINDLGEVVGTRSFRGNTGMVFSAPCYWGADRQPVDLMPTGFTQFPIAINDAGQVVGGPQRLDLRTGLVQDLGVPTGGITRYTWSRAVALNERGDVAATVITASSSGTQQAARWRDGEAWRVLGGLGPYDGASSLNARGDVGMVASFACPTTTARTAALYLDGEGTYCLPELLDAASRSWSIPSTSAPLVDDARRVVLWATNLVTGAAGTVLLTPGDTVPPSAPSGLGATPIAATWQQPYHQIELRWTDNSATELGFQVERRLQGSAAFAPWQTLARDTTSWRDTQLALGATYEYRVKALGLAGDSGYSNVASATAPTAPIDTTPPAIAVLSPSQGATVSGLVPVAFQASDATGVTFMQVVAPTATGEAVLCSTSTQSTLRCTWDTRALAPGAYAIQLYAGDAMNNGAAVSIGVTVAGAGAGLARCSGLVLGGSATRTRASPRATATIVDGAGQAIRSAWVTGRWTRPDGATSTTGAYTDRLGRALFSASGPRGTWTFTVTGVVRTGFLFDAAGSVLTARKTY